jgi:hypothetical protein
LILDDLAAEIDASVGDLYTRVSHHKHVSVIFLTQNLFQKNPHARTVSLNSHYILVMKSPRSIDQITVLARQMYDADWRFVLDAYRDATKTPYSYLLFDFKPETPDDFRLRTDVLPGQQTYCYVNPRLYEFSD